MFRVIAGKHEFYLTGKSIYIIYNYQKLMIKNWDNSDITATQYAELCDMIYRRKIKTSDDLYDIMGRYKLISTQRSLK